MNIFRYIILTPEQVVALDAGYKTGSKHHYRQRCHALLLSHARPTIGEISRLLNRHQETIRAWMNAFGKLGLGGLGIAFGRGRKAIIRIGAVMEAIKKK